MSTLGVYLGRFDQFYLFSGKTKTAKTIILDLIWHTCIWDLSEPYVDGGEVWNSCHVDQWTVRQFRTTVNVQPTKCNWGVEVRQTVVFDLKRKCEG